MEVKFRKGSMISLNNKGSWKLKSGNRGRVKLIYMIHQSYSETKVDESFSGNRGGVNGISFTNTSS